MGISTWFQVLTRKKVLNAAEIKESKLARVLNVYDLSALGIGASLGVGVYVLAGNVAKNIAGPSVVLSFLIAGIASIFAGLCYAEFGSRVPRAGSAYVYSYVTVGEFIAFIIGWNLILEYVIGSASCARGLTVYVDTFFNNSLRNAFEEIAPINVSFMSPYFDFFTFGISIAFSVALSFGMKESSFANNICTVINLVVVLFMIILGATKANIKNWELPPPANTTLYGTGGFFPYGISGTIQGAATCFYGFIGFDSIAATGEEVKNPQKSIPLSIIATLITICIAYLGTSSVLTLMLPYYLENVAAPIPMAFRELGLKWATYFVAVGSIFGLCTSLLGTIFPLPRVIYGMASDGIIFKFLGTVSPKYHTPLIGTLTAGFLIGIFGAVFNLDQLINMMSIATLLAYTIVSASVLLLRYSVDPEVDVEKEDFVKPSEIISEKSMLILDNKEIRSYLDWKSIFNCYKSKNATQFTQYLVLIFVICYGLLCILLAVFIMFFFQYALQLEIWAITLFVILLLLLFLDLFAISKQPPSKTKLQFMVPFVPLIPAISVFMNICLMVMLDYQTWIRFAVWMVLGFLMYGLYGYPNSKKSYEEYQTLKRKK